jgi:hypothetical protein
MVAFAARFVQRNLVNLEIFMLLADDPSGTGEL